MSYVCTFSTVQVNGHMHRPNLVFGPPFVVYGHRCLVSFDDMIH